MERRPDGKEMLALFLGTLGLPGVALVNLWRRLRGKEPIPLDLVSEPLHIVLGVLTTALLAAGVLLFFSPLGRDALIVLVAVFLLLLMLLSLVSWLERKYGDKG